MRSEVEQRVLPLCTSLRMRNLAMCFEQEQGFCALLHPLRTCNVRSVNCVKSCLRDAIQNVMAITDVPSRFWQREAHGSNA